MAGQEKGERTFLNIVNGHFSHESLLHFSAN